MCTKKLILTTRAAKSNKIKIKKNCYVVIEKEKMKRNFYLIERKTNIIIIMMKRNNHKKKKKKTQHLCKKKPLIMKMNYLSEKEPLRCYFCIFIGYNNKLKIVVHTFDRAEKHM